MTMFWTIWTRRLATIAVAMTVAIMTIAGVGANEEITVEGQHVETGPGGAVTFEVSGHSGPELGAFSIRVYYDEDMLEAISCQSEDALCVKGALPGELRINGASIKGYTGDISFATIVFNAGQTAGVVPIDIEVTAASDVVGGELGHLVTSSDGSVTIVGGMDSSPPGDANCDHEVTAADAIALLIAISGGDPGCANIADANCDDIINHKDVFAILRALGGLPYDVTAGCAPFVE